MSTPVVPLPTLTAEMVRRGRFRPAPDLLETRFLHAVATPSDINEHLILLRELAAQCEHVTEFGLRGGGGSTVALLAGQPLQFVSWDVNPFSIVQQNVLDLLTMQGRTRFQPRCGSTLEIITEPTDLLFIDTLHTREQLWAELKRHADPAVRPVSVRKFIAFHDTVTFGDVGEDGSQPGLLDAILFFQRKWTLPLWSLRENRKNNNGLIVLERAESAEQTPP